MAWLRLLIGFSCAACAGAGQAWAENVVVVLDRGAAAKAKAAEDGALAARLVQRCQERGAAVRAYAVGARANGKPRLIDLKVPLDAGQLKGLNAMEGTSFDGLSDVRVALAAALRGPIPQDPVVVVFVGPFGRVEPVPEGAGFALETWNRTAPSGSRMIPLALAPEAAKVLEGAKGWQAQGAIVLGVGAPVVEAEPWSAFDPEVKLRARLRVAVDSIGWGGGAAADLAASAGPQDVLTPAEGGFALERPLAAGLEAQLLLRIQSGPKTWSLAPPADVKVAVRWEQVKPEVRWLTEDGKRPRFTATDLERGAAREMHFRYRRTAPPAAQPAVEPQAPAEVPAGLVLHQHRSAELQLSAFLVEGELVLSAEYLGPQPVRWWGGSGGGSPPQPPWEDAPSSWDVASAAGRVRARLTAPEMPQALPPASTDRPWDLLLSAENKNAPEQVELVWRAEPPEAASRLELRVRRGDAEEDVWPSGEARPLPVGVPLKVRLLALAGDPPPVAAGSIHFEALPREQLEVSVEGQGSWRARRPRLLVGAGAVRYRMGSVNPAEESPLRLEADPDGADGTWLAWLVGRPPEVAVAGGAPQSFRLATLAPGRWEVRRDGAWRGGRAGVFEDREERVPLTITWMGRAEPQTVGVSVLVPARWGRMGWVLVGLAGAAVLLGLFALRSHRAAPINGTLLYTAESLEGAVGRLPLASVGRRRTPVMADPRGRLALGGEGAVLFHLRPTRVGGMVEIPGPGGDRERRLLVDGLSFSVGRHAVRYVQTTAEGADAAPPRATPAVPDLLGPEYDLPYGSQDSSAS